MKKPRIAIVGYGTMGKVIEKLALEKEFEISAIYDINDPLSKDKILDFDVAIDFTTPDVVLENVKYLSKNKKNIVIGTTGWYNNLELVRKLSEKYQNGILWGSNFSIGMQFFFRIIRKSAELLKSLEDFQVGIIETHHNRKKDFPSGTAITLAKSFTNELTKYSDFTTNPSEAVLDKSKLHITSLRLANVIGDHTVKFDSPYESIELTHSAKNREGFASGVLEAANWINDKKGFYSFDEVLAEIWDEVKDEKM